MALDGGFRKGWVSAQRFEAESGEISNVVLGEGLLECPLGWGKQSGMLEADQICGFG